MLYEIKDYLYDSNRMILYKNGMTEEKVKIINSAINSYEEEYNSIYNGLMEINADEMCMDRIEVDSCGIIPTYNCNLRCKYCAYSSGDNNSYKLALDDVKVFLTDIFKKKIINRLISKEDTPLHIDITGGGEPTFDWELLKGIVEYIKDECRKKGISYVLRMTSNGILNKAQINYIAENFEKLTISYDGLPLIHNRNRISPAYKDTNSIVENTIIELSKRQVALNIRTTIWEEDFSKIGEMYQYISSIIPLGGKATWSVWPTQYEGRAIDHMQSETNMPVKNMLRVCLNLKSELARNAQQDGIIDIELPIFINGPCEMFCGATAVFCPWLLPDASIVTCVESPSGRVEIGKVINGNVEYYRKYSDIFLKTTQRKYEECRDCMAFYFCRGGCPMWHLREENSGKLPHECDIQIEYLKYIIEAAIEGDSRIGWRLEPVNFENIDSQVYKLVKNVEE